MHLAIDKTREFDFSVSDELYELDDLILKEEEKYSSLFLPNSELDRKLVSFQANKKSPIYRLFKYKEGFSACLVDYFIERFGITDGPILDPFSGTGTTSIVSAIRGISSTAIELLPIGNLIAETRLTLLQGLTESTLTRIKYWKDQTPWIKSSDAKPLLTLRITEGAYPKKTEKAISKYMASLENEKDQVKTILNFALCSILEEVSYTRKDGQYLRWDYRSGRRAGKNTFDKGVIYSFEDAITQKLSDILDDAAKIQNSIINPRTVSLIEGTCLAEMQKLESNKYQAIITSPPYGNRYDYTRTYALELAALGIDHPQLIELRQTMLSCTVENKSKNLIAINPNWQKILSYCEQHGLLKRINHFLIRLKEENLLNNNGIPRMLDGYFKEMACVIYESARTLKSGGYMLVVNDNVRYAGVSIPVDTILSDIAARCGLTTENIMVLPTGKGNSSQQMGAHGRNALRKCVYIWRKL